MRLVEFKREHHDEVLALMKRTPGVTVRAADSRAAMTRHLERNPGLSFIAEVHGEIVGCALCGHDGRRGYLQHVLVSPAHRQRGNRPGACHSLPWLEACLGRCQP